MGRAREQYGISERQACRLLGQWRGTQRYEPMDRPEEDELTRAVIELARQYGRYGYRRITALLRNGGWQVGKDRVQRIWRREGLKGYCQLTVRRSELCAIGASRSTYRDRFPSRERTCPYQPMVNRF